MQGRADLNYMSFTNFVLSPIWSYNKREDNNRTYKYCLT